MQRARAFGESPPSAGFGIWINVVKSKLVWGSAVVGKRDFGFWKTAAVYGKDIVRERNDVCRWIVGCLTDMPRQGRHTAACTGSAPNLKIWSNAVECGKIRRNFSDEGNFACRWIKRVMFGSDKLVNSFIAAQGPSVSRWSDRTRYIGTWIDSGVVGKFQFKIESVFFVWVGKFDFGLIESIPMYDDFIFAVSVTVGNKLNACSRCSTFEIRFKTADCYERFGICTRLFCRIFQRMAVVKVGVTCADVCFECSDAAAEIKCIACSGCGYRSAAVCKLKRILSVAFADLDFAAVNLGKHIFIQRVSFVTFI